MQIPGLQKLCFEKGKITVMRFELLGLRDGRDKFEVYRLNIREAASGLGVVSEERAQDQPCLQQRLV